jgi:hypothetical protein
MATGWKVASAYSERGENENVRARGKMTKSTTPSSTAEKRAKEKSIDSIRIGREESCYPLSVRPLGSMM